MGGTIAYEMARLLEDKGKKIGYVLMLETYNIQTINFDKRTKLTNWVNRFENVIFHIENFFRAKEKFQFFLRKYQVEKSRMTMALSLLRQRLKTGYDEFEENNFAHLKIAKHNDQIQLAYKPGNFEGKVVLLKPKKFFYGLKDPSFGWSKLVKGGLEIRVMPVSPRGMLVEPFVATVAKEVVQAMEIDKERKV